MGKSWAGMDGMVGRRDAHAIAAFTSMRCDKGFSVTRDSDNGSADELHFADGY